MPIYKVQCNLCETETIHGGRDNAEAEGNHNVNPTHVENQKRWDALTADLDAKRASREQEFAHGKEHNA